MTNDRKSRVQLSSYFCEESKTITDFWQTDPFCLTGGSRGSNTNTWSTTETWKYITREGRWVTVAPMLRPRTNHTSATLNGEIYVIGGKKINIGFACGALNLQQKSQKIITTLAACFSFSEVFFKNVLVFLHCCGILLVWPTFCSCWNSL